MAYTPISALPEAPSRQDDGETFSNKADAFVAALPTFRTETNAAGSYIDGVATDVDNAKLAAQAAQTAAETAQTGAETARTGAETAQTNAEAAETSAEFWAGVAQDSVATLPEGTLNDSFTSTTTTWSSDKISTELTLAGTKGSLTASVKAGQEVYVPLASNVLAPVVSVTKEVPQIGVTNNQWTATTTNGFETEDFAYATGLTVVSAPDAVANAKYTGKFFDTSNEDATVNSVNFKSDGTKMYTLGAVSDSVFQYTLSTPWDLSTASYDSVSFSVAAQDTTPYGVTFRPDGTKMYMLGITNDAVYQYSLSTPWDLSTASYDSVSFSVAAQDTSPFALNLSTDGSKLYVAGNATDTVYQYTLSTPWDLSTASYDSVSLPTYTSPQGLSFNSTGDTLYVVDNATQAVYEYSLTVAWDLSTAVEAASSLLITPVDSAPSSIFVKPDNNTLFISGTSTDMVYEYTIATYTATLSTGAFAASDVGRVITDGTGEALLLDTAGTLKILTEFDTYDVLIPSGSWSLYGLLLGNTISVGSENVWVDVSEASYDSVSFSVGAQEPIPTAIYIKPDGTKMYMVGTNTDTVYQYTLSTPWDLSTASYDSVSFDVGGQETSPLGLLFKPDGTRFFILGSGSDAVRQYDLSTPWDISTASYNSKFASVSGQDTGPSGLMMSLDGSKMYVIGNITDTIYQYNLSTPWDVSQVQYTSVSLSVTAIETSPYQMAFQPDGTKMYLLGAATDSIHQYTLSTPWDLSTASYDSVSFSVAAQEATPTGLFFKPDGTKFYVGGSTTDTIYQYSLPSVAVVPSGYYSAVTNVAGQINTEYWTDLNSMTVTDSVVGQELYYTFSVDGKSTFVIVSEGLGERAVVRDNAGAWEYNSASDYGSETWTVASENTVYGALKDSLTVVGVNLSKASYTGKSYNVSSQEVTPYSAAFKPDGTKMYVIGIANDTAYQYTLSTPWDLSTASYDSVSFSVAAQDIFPYDLKFKSDGTKMYVLGQNSDAVHQYTLSTPWDISTASYDSVSFSVNPEDTSMQAVWFKPDGTRMYASGNASTTIYQYTLSTPWDLSTASYDSVSFNTTSVVTSPYSLALNSVGDTLLVLDAVDETLHEFLLSTPWDISTAVYTSRSLSVATEVSAALGITLGGSGEDILYLVDNGSDAVYQYDLTYLINTMTSANLSTALDSDFPALGISLDLAVTLKATDSSQPPVYEGTAIDYDANVTYEGAILGTDYDFDSPAQDFVRVTALVDNNIKVRVV